MDIPCLCLFDRERLRFKSEEAQSRWRSQGPEDHWGIRPEAQDIVRHHVMPVLALPLPSPTCVSIRASKAEAADRAQVGRLFHSANDPLPQNAAFSATMNSNCMAYTYACMT